MLHGASSTPVAETEIILLFFVVAVLIEAKIRQFIFEQLPIF